MINFNITDGIAVAEFDQPNSKANILNMDFFTRLNEILEKVEGNEDIKGLIFISKKPSIYLAGADLLSMKDNLTNEKWLRGVLRYGQESFNRIERLSIPTVAAINGACLGGGLELSLACKYRIASNEKCTKLGLPEVMLGILPAWGGTTRLPRMIGLPKSLQALLSGKIYAPIQALKLGMVDKICHKENLLKEAISFCDSKKPKRKVNKLTQAILLPISIFLSKRNVYKKTRGNYPAPNKIIEVVAKSFFKNKYAALKLEKKGFLSLAKTKACRNLIRVFFLQERAKKLPHGMPWYDPKLDKQIDDDIVVIGAGTMGAGIAQWISSRGKRVLLKDVSESAIASGLKKIGKLFVSAVLKHKIDRPTVRDCLGKLNFTKNSVPLSKQSLAIEAVVENFELKTKVLQEIESGLAEDAILATNTSALSITELSKGLKRPENFVGIHFFNPVHKMKLVEIVVGEKTSAETEDRAKRFVISIGKLPVVVKDSPGFLVNRILLPYLVEALRLFSDGHPLTSIENCMLDFGMPMGPLRLLDEIGLDVAAHVALDLEKRLDDFKVPQIIHKILETKQFGRKSGKGFFLYKGREAVCPNPVFLKMQKGNPMPCDIESKMVESMTQEAQKCIQEKVAKTTDDIDFAMIMGTGWAPFKGGPIEYSKFSGPH